MRQEGVVELNHMEKEGGRTKGTEGTAGSRGGRAEEEREIEAERRTGDSSGGVEEERRTGTQKRGTVVERKGAGGLS